MAILKPNIPLKYVKPDGTTQSEYPLTSIDQVIDEDGIHRLNQTVVRADLSNVEEGQVVLTNADLLENHPASYFATSEDMKQITSVIEAWTDGTNWYRVWSDGWLEQGGFVAYRGAGYFQVTLLKPYENEYYSLTGGCHTPDSSYSDHGYSVSFKMKTTTSFYTAINDDNSLNAGAWTWQACGQGR